MKNPSLSEQVSEWFVALFMVSLLLFAFRDAIWSNPAQNEKPVLVSETHMENPTQLHPPETDIEETAALQE